MINKKDSNRIRVLDFIRGTAVFFMVIYHTVFTLGEVFEAYPFTIILEYTRGRAPLAISFVFILVSAVSCTLSKNNLKRGAKIFAAALLITAVTTFLLPVFGLDGLSIKFGILHFLGAAIMLYPLIDKAVKRVPPAVGLPFLAFLYLFTFNISRGYLGFGKPVIFLQASFPGLSFLFPVGLVSPAFESADFYPLFPHMFLFAIGCYIGLYLKKHGFPDFAYKKIFPPFEFSGRHALPIYLIHQPVIFLFSYLILG
ncbi:MAG: DUF1624 domain-containing protein [Oscillospiraceae bacterium]|nr:DUF1624 domain-containing protein [Oscillospiraceae bacterium]